ncbi:helix-turn-helix domain-containing protein [Chungangia koreensis]
MSSIGQMIRQERFKQKMKQSTLAEGICSASHLSKIENGTAIPSEEVLQLLLNKLGIEIKELSHQDESRIISSLQAVYKEGILKRNKEEIREYLQQFAEHKIHFQNLHNFYTYNLLMFRLFLILQDQDQDLSPFIEALRSVEDQFDHHQKFIFNINVGLFEFFEYKFHSSLLSLEKNLELTKKALLEDWELADFHSILGNIYHKNGENFSSVNFTTTALEYYKNHLYFERAMDCYILLGISYRNLNHFKKARENYSLALKLAEDFNLPYYKGMCYHNLGTLYSLEGNSEKALEYFHISLDLKKTEQHHGKVLVTIHALIVEYSKLGNSMLVLRWCQKGIDYLKNELTQDRSALPITYHYHFSIYKALHTNRQNLDHLLKEAVKHFEKTFDLRHIQKYSILLGDHLFHQNKFKLAGEFYQKANNVIYKQRNVEKWEDL